MCSVAVSWCLKLNAVLIFTRQVEQGKDASSKKSANVVEVVVGTNSELLTTGVTEGGASKWYKCMDCCKQFSSQAKLSAHMKAHSVNFHCTVQVGMVVIKFY